MSLHLRLLAEQAEEALQQEESLRDQAAILAVDVAQARPGPIRLLLARIGRRPGG